MNPLDLALPLPDTTHTMSPPNPTLFQLRQKRSYLWSAPSSNPSQPESRQATLPHHLQTLQQALAWVEGLEQ